MYKASLKTVGERLTGWPLAKVAVWVTLVVLAFLLDPLIELALKGRFELFEPKNLLEGLFFAGAMIAMITGYECFFMLRLRTRRVIEESESRFRNLIEGSLQGIFVHREFRFLFVNQALVDVYGYDSPEEMLAIGDMTQVIAPEDRERMRGYYHIRIAGGEPVSHYEFQGIRKDGARIWLEAMNRTVDWDGRAAIQATLIDITERKQAESALRESEERLKAILNNANVVIYMKDKEGRYSFINRHFEKVIGLGNEEVQGKTDFDILPEEFAESLTKNDRAVLEQAKPMEFEELAPHNDEPQTYLSLKFPLFDLSGAVTGVCGISTNITERKKEEEALREAKERAEAATELKDKFVSLVAHDLRSPFASIIGYLQLMRDDENHPLDGQQRELMGRVLEKGEGLVRMIDELLNISRLQTGKIVPELQFVDAQLVTSLARGYVSQTAADKGIEIVNDVPAHTRIYTDINLLSEVFQNLLSNAIKFSLQDGSVRMYVPEGQPNTIAVSDLGMGISESMFPDLFKHEIKTSSVGTAGEMGTGLGLPFCGDIMKALGGTLRAESKEGEGTTFFVNIPPARPQILIADDEQRERDTLRKHLDGLEVDIIEVTDGESAMQAIGESPPSLIIANVSMPKLDGFGVLEAVKNDPSTNTIPILLITSNSETETREKAFRLGADDFLNRPLEPSDFIPRVRRFLG
jgi:PAS domain S-box-containing protein